MDADAVELRVLGCLIEKQRVTPDQYLLSLNALRLAANQTTNRECRSTRRLNFHARGVAERVSRSRTECRPCRAAGLETMP